MTKYLPNIIKNCRNFQDLELLAHFSISLSTFLTMNVLSCLKNGVLFVIEYLARKY